MPSSWVVQFEKASVWKTTEELRAELDSMVVPDQQDDRDTYELARAVAERVLAYRRGGDAIGFSADALASVDGRMRVLVQTVRDWFSGAAVSASVGAAADAVVNDLSAWPSPTGDQIGAAASSVVADISNQAAEAIESLTEKRDDLVRRLKDVRQDLAEAQQAHEALVQQNEVFLSGRKSAWATALKKEQASARQVVDDLAGYRDEARGMVHESTSLMVGGEYADYAREKSRSAWMYDVAAVVFGIIGLGSLSVFVLESQNEADISISLALSRLGITLGAIVIGGFLATRGADHHSEAKQARRTSLALSRLAPFTAALPPDAREVLVVETADRIFTRGELGEVTPRDSVMEKLQRTRKANDEAIEQQSQSS